MKDDYSPKWNISVIKKAIKKATIRFHSLCIRLATMHHNFETPLEHIMDSAILFCYSEYNRTGITLDSNEHSLLYERETSDTTTFNDMEHVC